MMNKLTNVSFIGACIILSAVNVWAGEITVKAHPTYISSGPKSESYRTVKIFYDDGIEIAKQTIDLQGNVEQEGEIPDGIVKSYYNSGALQSEKTYMYNKLNGVAKEYYLNGNMHSETYYLNDLMDGPFKMYYESGKLYMTAYYKADQFVGLQELFDEQGKTITVIDHSAPEIQTSEPGTDSPVDPQE